MGIGDMLRSALPDMTDEERSRLVHFIEEVARAVDQVMTTDVTVRQLGPPSGTYAVFVCAGSVVEDVKRAIQRAIDGSWQGGEQELGP